MINKFWFVIEGAFTRYEARKQLNFKSNFKNNNLISHYSKIYE